MCQISDGMVAIPEELKVLKILPRYFEDISWLCEATALDLETKCCGQVWWKICEDAAFYLRRCSLET